MSKGDDIEERLIGFGVRVIRLCGRLPDTFVAQHIGKQLIRSGTAPAAHYAEARGAESNRDFVHKLKICLKELNESRIWLKFIIQSELQPENLLTNLHNECDELCRIINASIKTTTTNHPR